MDKLSFGKGKLFKDLSFDETIEYLRKSSIGTPKRINIDLSVAHTDQELGVAGNFIYIIDATTFENNSVDLKLNEQREPAFTYYKMMGILSPFEKFYYSNAAQVGGWITIMYGTLAPTFLNIIDNRSPGYDFLNAINTVLDEQLRGDTLPDAWNRYAVTNAAGGVEIWPVNLTRRELLINADSTNTGLIYVGFDNTVAATKAIAALAAGQSLGLEAYRGIIRCIASAAGQFIFGGEW
ncbi:hypothetical protein ES702_05956 [subsurface metagenome]